MIVIRIWMEILYFYFLAAFDPQSQGSVSNLFPYISSIAFFEVINLMIIHVKCENGIVLFYYKERHDLPFLNEFCQ